MNQTPTVHLICNAHLDPMWQWEWEEGAAEAVNTYRHAADFCESFDGFVFCHNEALLYQWVLEYEPRLFKRIQTLVRQGRWHIMGGWHVQPDCNMPSGESFVRQALLGLEFFKLHFGCRPTTAINFDSFGHTRGLVQILRKSGYDAYLFCRPWTSQIHLPGCFTWEGFAGTRILAAHYPRGYNTGLGKARRQIEEELNSGRRLTPNVHLFLWGVGNHGGGASRKDLRDLAALMRGRKDLAIRHSTPDAFFKDLRRRGGPLPSFGESIRPFAVGCYTSQVRIKQAHRLLENELFLTEKMATAAWFGHAMPYPAAELDEAMRDLATAQFHDILPGSSIQRVEETGLRLMNHGLEILSRVRQRAFLVLAGGEPKAAGGLIPVLVYNPHPFPVRRTVECEFMLPDQNWSGTFTSVRVCRNGRELPSQVEKERSDVPLDWRKRVAFVADLAPSQMNRFDCRLEALPARPAGSSRHTRNCIDFRTDRLHVRINTRTGLVDRYCVDGTVILKPGAFRPLILRDTEDSWGMTRDRFRDVVGAFRLLNAKACACFSGVEVPTLPAVRVIEDGTVRMVVEAVFGYRDSRLCLRYTLPKAGTQLAIEIRSFFMEKDRMLKLSIPTVDVGARYVGQTAFGVETLPNDGRECVAQKWVAALVKPGRALTIINEGCYGSDCKGGEVRLSLLRTAGYCAHPLAGRVTLRQDRFTGRMDQGERRFRFWLDAGPERQRLDEIDRDALVCNETPVTLSFFPSGLGRKGKPLVQLSDKVVQISAIKKAQCGRTIVIRVFEPTGRKRTTVLSLPALGVRRRLSLRGFEVRTVAYSLASHTWREVNLVEEPLMTRCSDHVTTFDDDTGMIESS